MSGAERAKRYREKLKLGNKHDEYKKKQAKIMKANRARKKEEEEAMKSLNFSSPVMQRRAATLARVKKHRENKKSQENVPIDNQSQPSNLAAIVSEVYSCNQTLGKAVKKVSNALPASPRKRNAILTHIVSNLAEADKEILVNVVAKPKKYTRRSIVTAAVDVEIRKFYNRDDISRMSPNTKDVKQYKCPETGEEVRLSARHMVLSLREAHSLFIEEMKSKQFGMTIFIIEIYLLRRSFILNVFHIRFIVQGVCSLIHFQRHRPQHVKLINQWPHNTCLCSYHSNNVEAVNVLHKNIPDLPSYEKGFVNEFLCEEPSKDCWFARCNKCSGITIDALKTKIGDIPFDKTVSWIEWTKNKVSNRVEKKEKDGKISALIAHVDALSPHFLKHSYIKREQSDVFNLYDLPRASDTEFALEALIQVDFAENFVCEQQDEVQTAHWNQLQLTLFTTGLYYNGTFQSKVYVSNNLIHNKETIIPYICKLLKGLPESVRILKVWSDGPTSQFKNNFIAAMIPVLEAKFNLKIVWNFFATAHGKGCVDGLGATVKQTVRKHIKARDSIVGNAAQFVEAFKRTPSKILVEEVTEEEISTLNDEISADEVYASAPAVKNILSAHQIQVLNGKLVTFETSKEGYNAL